MTAIFDFVQGKMSYDYSHISQGQWVYSFADALELLYVDSQ